MSDDFVRAGSTPADVSLGGTAAMPNESASSADVATAESNATETASANTDAMDEAIRLRAYELYMSRGEGPGDAFTDWITAEHEIRTKGDEGHGHG